MANTNVWLINGIPGVGKSTTARHLAASLPRAAHVEGDALHQMITSGAVSPGQEPHYEEAAQIRLCVRQQCLLARSFAQAGFVPVLDYVVVNQQRLNEYLDQLEGLTLRLVTLAPGTEIALARDLARPEKTVAAAWTHLDAGMREELGDSGLWVDNALLTVDETVARILENAGLAVVSPGRTVPSG